MSYISYHISKFWATTNLTTHNSFAVCVCVCFVNYKKLLLSEEIIWSPAQKRKKKLFFLLQETPWRTVTLPTSIKVKAFTSSCRVPLLSPMTIVRFSNWSQPYQLQGRHILLVLTALITSDMFWNQLLGNTSGVIRRVTTNDKYCIWQSFTTNR